MPKYSSLQSICEVLAKENSKEARQKSVLKCRTYQSRRYVWGRRGPGDRSAAVLDVRAVKGKQATTPQVSKNRKMYRVVKKIFPGHTTYRVNISHAVIRVWCQFLTKFAGQREKLQ